MTFNFFSLDYIYYPVSGIMWVWHKVFGSFLGPSNPWAWVLSVVFLVFTLRAILFKPFLKQMDSQLKMQAVQPEMKKLREKYKDDRQRLAEEMMKFNKEAGVNPLASCLPALIQAPVFIGLFHVLRSFKPGWGQVYFFGASDVNSFVEAKLFGGAPLSSFMTMPADQLAVLGGVRSTIITTGIPLTILAGIATFLTSRRSVLRQRELNPESAANPQAAIMNRLMMYVFPLFVVLGGPFFPLAILFYWLSNNSWTFGQLFVAHRLQDRKKAAETKVVEEAKQAASFTKPLPGARPRPGARPDPRRPVIQPTSLRKDGPSAGTSASTNGSSNGRTTAGSAPVRPATSADAATNGTASPGTPGPVDGADGAAVRGPRPGARPQNRPSPSRKKKSGRR
ncbi:membrane protein insertase YidC [Nakamurella endophytica]|uniref:Membrane protein insertase YidC n=1 Tax=Nakamurella endophytica TaxID=1748367 RepID=A0A917SVD3_9ACTN|nr:membrane protein insertase YidC [Nakamurella endophytica]GGL97354.1 membrane protein OxaA [Nakamurella endophytica]